MTTLPGTLSCTSGAPDATACGAPTTAERSRYSTLTSSAASCAAVALSATISATGSPLKRTRPCASAGRPGWMSSMPPRPFTGSAHGSDFSAALMSSPVMTAMTPGCASAALASSATMSACARSERRKNPYACPGRFQSETYFPRPVSIRSSSSLPFTVSALRECDEDAARRVVEERSPDRALPPARRKGGGLVVADHDQVYAGVLGVAADLLDRLADGDLPRGVEAALAQRADALVEYSLGALLLFLEELLRHEAFGEEQARRHARHGEQMRLGAEKAREVRGFQQRPLALLRAVVRQKNLAILHPRSPLFALISRAAPPALWSHVRRQTSATPSARSPRSTGTSKAGRAARASSCAPDLPSPT